jgi:predicted membrane-bound spermidine synthase
MNQANRSNAPGKTATPYPLFYAISFLEGAAVMACELIGAKLIAPYYGNSLYVWTSVLGTTLGGLTAGYYLGGMISEKPFLRRNLRNILIASTALFAVMPRLSSLVMNASLSFSIQVGSLLSCIVFIFPLLLCFGMVSPLVIRIVSENVEGVGKKAGTVYAISTLGGILMTFTVAFYSIPSLGLAASSYATAGILLAAAVLSMIAPADLSGSAPQEVSVRKAT